MAGEPARQAENEVAPCDRELLGILAERRLTPVFQPLVSLCRRTVFGYEALIRGPEDSALHSPMALFETAERCGHLADLELLARELSVQQFGRLKRGGRLFLNITPEALLDPAFRSGRTLEYLRQAGVLPQQVVIEITEHRPIRDYGLMREAFAHYRSMGFAIAIDDLGAGYAGLRQWSELPPDYVKVDRHFIQDVDQEAGKRQFLRSICEISQALGCKVIAEGVETRGELDVLYELGIPYAQGFYFARPEACPPETLAADGFPLSRRQNGRSYGSERVAGLVRPRPILRPEISLDETVGRFRDQPGVGSLAVVQDERPVGTVTRSEIMNLYSGRFGRELYGRRPVTQFMNRAPLVVTKELPLEDLSSRITEARDRHTVEDDFVVVDQKGRYVGMGTILELLERLTDLKVRNARYANPLTQLPGNVPINEQIDRRLGAGELFTLVYCDVDHFKPFNDKYGYARGDEVIRYIGRLLSEHTEPGVDFVGHIGGDDFVLIFGTNDWKQRCNEVLRRFGDEAAGLYDEGDRGRGGLVAEDRQGQEVFYPFLSLSLGAVPVEPGQFDSHLEVAARACEVKNQAKKRRGNALFVDRRAQAGRIAVAPQGGTRRGDRPVGVGR